MVNRKRSVNRKVRCMTLVFSLQNNGWGIAFRRRSSYRQVTVDRPRRASCGLDLRARSLREFHRFVSFFASKIAATERKSARQKPASPGTQGLCGKASERNRGCQETFQTSREGGGGQLLRSRQGRVLATPLLGRVGYCEFLNFLCKILMGNLAKYEIFRGLNRMLFTTFLAKYQ